MSASQSEIETRRIVAKAVRDLRKSLKMSQQQFANLVHKPQSTIGRIEAGTVSVRLDTLTDIAFATNTKLEIGFEDK